MYNSFKYEGGYGDPGSLGYGGDPGSMDLGGDPGSMDLGGDPGSLGYGGDPGSLDLGGDSGALDYSINNIVLGFGSIMLFINILMGLYICAYHTNPENKKKRISMVNPLTRNGTVWTNCSANKG